MSVLKRNLLYGGAVFILILSAITFVFIPASGRANGGHSLVFGKWDGKPIEYVQGSFFLRQIQTLMEQMKTDQQDVNQLANYQIMQSAFNSAAIRLAILSELNEAGYKIPEITIDKVLVQSYLDEHGKYSSKIYSDTPEATRASHRAMVSEDLTAQRYIDDVLGTQTGLFGLKTTTRETDLIKTMSGPERSFTYASFTTDAYPESEVIAYGQANAAKFVKHDLSIITVDTEPLAKRVAANLEKKEISFEDAVTTYSTRTGTDAAGKLIKSFRSDLNALFADAKDLETVLALKPAAVSTIVKTGKTFAIVRCDALPADPDFTNPAIVSAVSTYMNNNERGKIEDYFMAKAKEFAAAAKASGFDKACAAFGIAKKTTGAFGINYGNAKILAPLSVEANPELAAAVKSESFFKTAFSLKPTDISEPVLLGSSVLVLQIAEEKAADPQMMEMLPLFYNYYAGSWSQQSLTQAFLKSKKLQDNFMATYLANFLSKDKEQK